MRRKDREITDPAEIEKIIKRGHVLHLGIVDEDCPYVVPVNYGYEIRDSKVVLYFHGAKVGKKIELLKACNTVGFEIECDAIVATADKACDFSEYYQSVIGRGQCYFLEDVEEKRYALLLLMEHNTGNKGWVIPELMINGMAVAKIQCTEISAKTHKK